MTHFRDRVNHEPQGNIVSYEDLKKGISASRKVLIAFSGGVDSTLLLRCAVDVLGKANVLAATAMSATYPEWQLEDAKRTAVSLGIKHVRFETDELNIKGFRQNPPDRCYHCKKELYLKLIDIAEAEGCDSVFDGSNVDDTSDYRPGLKALQELGIRSPLIEAGLAKSEIRAISKELGLSTWDKPSFACLSSRFPYGSEITEKALSMVDRAENILRDLGFGQLRVRHYGDLARIEVNKDDIGRLFTGDVREKTVRALKEIGYQYICLDLEGYRTGSMNEILIRDSSEVPTEPARGCKAQSDTPSQRSCNHR